MRPTTRWIVAAAVSVLSAVTAPAAHAQILTFDDITIPSGSFRASLPTPYSGFTFAPVPGTSDQGAFFGGSSLAQTTGYKNQVVSGANAFYSIFGASISSPTAFTFNDGYFGTPFKEGATMTVLGRLLGSTVFTTTFTVNATAPTFRTFNWTNIDQLVFSVTGGTNLFGATDYMTADNLRFNNAQVNVGVVPEPATVTLLAGGLLALGVAARARRRVS